MISFLYNLLIMPIELLVEITYSVMYRLLGNCGLAILAVSLVIQTLILPLYRRADAVQDEERQKQKEMAYWTSHIRKTFKGDERFMMLSTYYRQQKYKPLYALKSSISILLQIPFFIAAYHYLSGLSALEGDAFLFIRDLSQPDQIIMLGGLPVNVLPILMTFFNIISGVIYTRGLSVKDKVQVYSLAAVFLVLLYNSPSGLVLYWTMNNLYSLMKNIITKQLAGRINLPHIRFAGLRKIFNNSCSNMSSKEILGLYMITAVFLTAFIGGGICSNIVSASPAEFVSSTYGPLEIVFTNITIFAGIFLVWGMIFITIMRFKTQYLFWVITFVFSGVAIIDLFGFGNNLGRMSALLVYDTAPSFTFGEKLINLCLICTVAIILVRIAVKHITVAKRILQVLALGTCAMCVMNIISLKKEINIIQERLEEGISNDEQILKINKNGKNVIIIMLDRAINGYIPYIFDEKPELMEAFEGFTYYPNTLSYGQSTNLASPALFGGYEYSPIEINKRTSEKLIDKHNEALLVLPRIFADEGYDVTVCDPPYAGSYEWTPDLSLYDKYENINAYITEGSYTDEYFESFAPSYKDKQKLAFVYHCMMKAMPVVAQSYMYNNGEYLLQSKLTIKKSFLDCYSVLINLKNITEISDAEKDSFICLQNSTTHAISLLKTPEYVPDENISIDGFNKELSYEWEDKSINGHTLIIDNQYQAAHYQSNMAAMMALAEWFEYLKECGCWDNTRIIIVSDHGNGIGNFDYMVFDESLDIEWYNPLLMVKDFNSHIYTELNDFMTNADVPTLALEGLVQNPTNPFTGKEISSDAKREPIYVTVSKHWETTIYNGNTFDTSDAPWYAVEDNIFDRSNWKLMEEVE